jgi:hypothetical protein
MEMNWSRWFRCESSFELLLVPKQPGIYALAEEIVQPAGPSVRRMLAVCEVEETDDLARALSRLFAAGSRWRQRLAEARCYLRYAVAPEAAERHGAAMALKNWLNSQREAAAQIFESTWEPPRESPGETEAATEAERAVDRVVKGHEYAKVFPAGF